MEVVSHFFAHPSELDLLDLLCRLVQDGETPSGIHEKTVYDRSRGTTRPVLLLHAIEEERGEGPRPKRVVGSRTWNGERAKTLFGNTEGGVRKQVGP